MKLEVGKYYRTRDGRKVGPVRDDYDDEDGFNWHLGPDDGNIWDCNGTSLGRYREADLIAELTDEPPTGTLAELNVKPGDVVEWRGTTHNITKIEGDYGIAISHIDSEEYYIHGSDPIRIISRASTTQSPVRTVTRTSLEIVPGVYGKVQVNWSNDEIVQLQFKGDHLTAAVKFTRADLTAVIQTLTAIRSALA